ncbi:MAG: hypothetical protein WA369_05020, partial [Candidatus Acidiferrales bacterium]
RAGFSGLCERQGSAGKQQDEADKQRTHESCQPWKCFHEEVPPDIRNFLFSAPNHARENRAMRATPKKQTQPAKIDTGRNVMWCLALSRNTVNEDGGLFCCHF